MRRRTRAAVLPARHDVLVIGSGFGGAVSALRLTEKGYGIGVLEAGDRHQDAELPQTSWRLRRYLWAPALGLRGIQRLHFLRRLVVLAGAGVGGGSLVFGNTLCEPPPEFYDSPQWAHLTDWRAELAPFYEQARRMLGATVNPTVTAADRALREIGECLGEGARFGPVAVAVHFGPPGSDPHKAHPDPYFGGAGPERTGCTECGACMTGCRQGAKNTLTKNYLHLAEQAGARIHPGRTVTSLRPLTEGGWEVESRASGSWFGGRQRHRADQVVLAAGTVGTQTLLLRMARRGVLPHLSPRLGALTRAGADVLAAVRRGPGEDHTRGVSITSSLHPDERTCIEPVRLGRGSNLLGLMSAPLLDGAGRIPRPLAWAGQALRHPIATARFADVRRWSERAVITFVMRRGTGTFTGSMGPSPLVGRLRVRPDAGAEDTSWIPVVTAVVRRLAGRLGATPTGHVSGLFGVPIVAPLLGGCPIGGSAADGVVDPYHRAYGYEGLHIVDGSTVCADLGTNPALTITAQAERAMSMWPNKAAPDPRPGRQDTYRPVAWVAPRFPAVPPGAPAALLLEPAGEPTPAAPAPPAQPS